MSDLLKLVILGLDLGIRSVGKPEKVSLREICGFHCAGQRGGSADCRVVIEDDGGG